MVLASASPRRRELLSALGFQFVVSPVDIDEGHAAHGLPPRERAEAIARAKADVARAATLQPVVAADTIVIAPDGEALGKPKDEADALRMLRLLSGATHTVETGVAIATGGVIRTTFTAVTRVTFRAMTDDEMLHYIRTCRPYDKAGAYGIQEWIGHAAVTAIEGEYNNVVGLPTARLYEALKTLGIHPEQSQGQGH